MLCQKQATYALPKASLPKIKLLDTDGYCVLMGFSLPSLSPLWLHEILFKLIQELLFSHLWMTLLKLSQSFNTKIRERSIHIDSRRDIK